MKLVDANVLLYAVDRGAEHHRVAEAGVPCPSAAT